MPVTDTVADVLTRLRNANRALHDSTVVPTSKFTLELLRILQEEGYIRGFEAVPDSAPQEMTRVHLKYVGPKRERVLNNLQRVSKPGLRVYKPNTEIPRVLKGLGIAIVSTSRGLVTDRVARKLGVGGEVICHVW
ncbi:MAG: 30S ribosomal protein S8 [Armatimonadetes bacterium]|nr:30S ribosomal protein S8 [Armatimonadota bacterium]